MSLALISNNVKAEEKYKDVTEDIEVRYKWYKEKITGGYYPLKEEQDGYIVDITKIKEGAVSTWNNANCNLPRNHYFIEYDFTYTYECVKSVRYVEIKNIKFNDNIKVYHDNELIDYRIVTNKENFSFSQCRQANKIALFLWFHD